MKLTAGMRVKYSDISDRSIPADRAARGTIVNATADGRFVRVHWDSYSTPEPNPRNANTVIAVVTSPSIGQSVTIAIVDHATWANGAAESLNGMTGIVEEIQTTHRMTSIPLRVPRVLVRFSERPKRWSVWQIPSHAWWFEPHDLVQVPESSSVQP